MILAIIAGVFNTIVTTILIVLTYYRGYEYFFENQILFTTGNIIVAFIISLIISAGIAYLFTTSFSDKFINKLNGYREPILSENERLLPLLEEVHNKAVLKYNLNRRELKLRIKDSKLYGMFAGGLSTVVINRSVLKESSDETIKALIAHEIGHIYNDDSKWLAMISAFMIIGGVAGFVSFAITVGLYIISRSLRSGMLFFGGMFFFLVAVGAAIVTSGFIIFFFAFIGTMRYAMRKSEYKADSFAAKLGYTDELISFFDAISEQDYEEKKFYLRIFNTHPKNILRMGKLEELKKGNCYA